MKGLIDIKRIKAFAVFLLAASIVVCCCGCNTKLFGIDDLAVTVVTTLPETSVQNPGDGSTVSEAATTAGFPVAATLPDNAVAVGDPIEMTALEWSLITGALGANFGFKGYAYLTAAQRSLIEAHASTLGYDVKVYARYMTINGDIPKQYEIEQGNVTTVAPTTTAPPATAAPTTTAAATTTVVQTAE